MFCRELYWWYQFTEIINLKIEPLFLFSSLENNAHQEAPPEYATGSEQETASCWEGQRVTSFWQQGKTNDIHVIAVKEMQGKKLILERKKPETTTEAMKVLQILDLSI